MVNLAQKKEENDRINELLRKEEECPVIEEAMAAIVAHHKTLLGLANQKAILTKVEQEVQAEVDILKEKIKTALTAVEEKTGFAKMPTEDGTPYLRKVAESYKITDEAGVPPYYVVSKTVTSIDKKKINQDIKDGVIDLKSNWLELVPATRTLVI